MKKRVRSAENWQKALPLVEHLMQLSLLIMQNPSSMGDLYSQDELAFIQNELMDVSGTLDLQTGWQKRVILSDFEFNALSHPWGRVLFHYSGHAASGGGISLTPSEIPYFMLPQECFQCFKKHIHKYDAETGKKLHCPECTKAEEWPTAKGNVGRALELLFNWGNDRQGNMTLEGLIAEVLVAFEFLWGYMNKPYTPRYQIIEPFYQVPMGWMIDVYQGKPINFLDIGIEQGAKLFPVDPEDLSAIRPDPFEESGIIPVRTLTLIMLDQLVAPRLSSYLDEKQMPWNKKKI